MYLAPCGSDDSCNFKKTTKPPGGLAEDSTCLKGDSSPLLQVPVDKRKNHVHGFRRGLVGGWFACQWASCCRTVEAPQDMKMQECISRSEGAGTWWFLRGQPIIPRFYVDLALKTIVYEDLSCSFMFHDWCLCWIGCLSLVFSYWILSWAQRCEPVAGMWSNHLDVLLITDPSMNEPKFKTINCTYIN